MKNLTADVVVSIVCMALVFAGLLFFSVAVSDTRATFILILAWYFAAIIIFYIWIRKYF